MASSDIISAGEKYESFGTKSDLDIETIAVSSKPSSTKEGEGDDVSKRTRVIDGVNVIGLSDDDFEFNQRFTPQMRKKLNRKVDIRLIPILGMLYLVSNLDRVNIGNAKIEGMDRDLNLTGVQYNTALSVFFISYILMEIPSNTILKQISRPSWYLGGMAAMFGVTTTCTAFVQNFSQLAGVRFVLGIFEAGFLPAAFYLVGTWYSPLDMGLRAGGFFMTGALSGAFGGLLAAGLSQMDGIGGYEGWRWIFLIEGVVTIGCGIICIFFMIDLPSRSMNWLEPEEMRFLEVQRLIKQGGLKIDGSDIEGGELGFGGLYELKMVATNWRMWAFAFITICESAAFYGMKFSLPTITKAMGFSSTNAQLLSCPPYVAGAIGAVVLPWISDHYKHRAFWNALSFVLMIGSYAVILGLQGNTGGANLGLSYTANMVSAVGVYGSAPVFFAWASNNCAPAGRRAMCSAWMISFGNLGGITGSFIYLDREAPAYSTGFGILVAFSLAGLITTFAVWYSYRRENQARAKISEAEVRSQYSDAELLRMGDRSPLFKYTL